MDLPRGPLPGGFRGINRRDRLQCNGFTPGAPHSNPAAMKCSSTKDSSASLRSSAISAMADESQVMIKKVWLIGLGGVNLLAFSKLIFPLVLLAGGSYIARRALFKE